MQRSERVGSRMLATVVVLALIYFVAAKIGLGFAVVADQVTLVWPPSGIALAAVLLFGRRVWPGILFGAFLVNVTSSETGTAALAIATGNTLEGLLGGYVLERAGFRRSLMRLRDALALTVLAALLSTAVTAFLGSLTLVATGLQSRDALPALFRDWWIGDAVGVLTFTPLLLSWWEKRRANGARAVAEVLMLALALVAVGVAAMTEPSPTTGVAYPLHYLALPFVAWGALRFGSRGSSLVVLAVSAIAVASMRFGFEAFGAGAGEHALLLAQLFIGVVAITGLLLGVAIDERNAAHDALAVAEAHQRLALSAARAASWDYHFATGTVKWSPGLERVQGLPAGAFDGRFSSFKGLVHPDDRERVEAAIDHAVGTGGEFESEFRNLRADGVHWLLGKGRVLTNAHGVPERLVGIGMDITERKQLDEERRKRAEDLIEQDKKKDEFMATLAHELRNPLAPIAGAVRLLKDKGSDPAAVERLRQILDRQITHLLRLVDDLLDVSRITRGKVKLQLERVELQQVLRSSIEMSASLLESRGLELICELPKDPLWVNADAVRLAQVAQNLLSNAARHGGDGGHVWLAAREESGVVVFSVRDDGAGMNEDVRRHAFEPFSQGPGTGRSVGLGIGLTLVRELAQLHGGRVEAYSAGPGQGSEFRVYLPRSLPDASRPPVAPMEAKEQAADGQRDVLVVDDNVDAAEMLAALLQHRGHRVSVVHNGAHALEHTQSSTPDVVLLDIEMPIMNGYDVARAIRKDPRLKGTRLIAVSGHILPGERERPLNAGFDLHMAKPVDPEALYAALERRAS